MSAFDLLELRTDLTAVLHELAIAKQESGDLDRLIDLHVSNRQLAAGVLNKRLQAELREEAADGR